MWAHNGSTHVVKHSDHEGDQGKTLEELYTDILKTRFTRSFLLQMNLFIVEY